MSQEKIILANEIGNSAICATVKKGIFKDTKNLAHTYIQFDHEY